MRDLKIEETSYVSGGPVVFAIPVAYQAVLAVAGAVVAVGSAIKVAYDVGAIAGEATQRNHEANHQCSTGG